MTSLGPHSHSGAWLRASAGLVCRGCPFSWHYTGCSLRMDTVGPGTELSMMEGEEESLQQSRREVNIKNIFPVVKQGKKLRKLLSQRKGNRGQSH